MTRLPHLLAALCLAAPLAAQTFPAGGDLRDGLGSGLTTAGVAMEGMRLIGSAPKPAPFDSMVGLTFVNSDLAFRGNLVYQGNFSGFSIWDVSDPAQPQMLSVVECVTSQGDPSIVGNLLVDDWPVAASSSSVVRASTECMSTCSDTALRSDGAAVWDSRTDRVSVSGQDWPTICIQELAV